MSEDENDAPDGRLLNPGLLRWSHVDPARHPFDPRSVATVVRSLPAAGTVPFLTSRPTDPGWLTSLEISREWIDDMSRGLAGHYGRWACGWSYSQGWGGPVRSFHSLWHTAPAAVLAQVEASVVEWRSWVEEVDELFRRHLPIAPSATDDEVRDDWERAVAQLVTVVAERTDANDSWYEHCRQVLGWFLSAAGVPDEQHDELVLDATSGRFRSWLGMSDEECAEIGVRLAEGALGPRGT